MNPPLCANSENTFNGSLVQVFKDQNYTTLQYNFPTNNTNIIYNCVFISIKTNDYSIYNYNNNSIVYRDCIYTIPEYKNGITCYTGRFKRADNYDSAKYQLASTYLSAQLILAVIMPGWIGLVAFDIIRKIKKDENQFV